MNRLLLRDGVPVPLTAKVFDILLLFAANPGRLLDKDELIEKIWHSEFVEEGNLARNISSLRKALGDTGREHKYILTVQGHGYRFVADVTDVDAVRTAATRKNLEPVGGKYFSRRPIGVISLAVLIFTAAVWLGGGHFSPPGNQIRSLAVLPLRSLDSGDNYLGIGIADAVIRKISQTGQMTVRPTSAVLHYANQDSDPLAAARELSTDAVLDGNIQRAGDRMRVSVNLLRTGDGMSLWADNFDMPVADIFAIQDRVAQQVADRLKVGLAMGGAALVPKLPASAAAHDWYIRGLFSLDQRGFDHSDLGHMLDTIAYFKHAIETDPTYAIAHGQLAFSYAWLAMFVDPNETKWAGLARQEIARSLELDPNIAEPHVAKALLYWSVYGGKQTESAIRELRLAKQLDPNYCGADLAALYAHVGLEQEAVNELNRARSIDPTSLALKGLTGILPYLRGDLDGWVLAAPNVPIEDRTLSRWYYMHKGSLDLAENVLDKQAAEDPDNQELLTQRALLSALKGDFKRAEGDIPRAFAKIQRNAESYHHRTFDAACVYAIAGNSTEAVKWLRETADAGFPNYPLFAREPFLDRIRQAPEFVQFMVDEKAQWEKYKQEFGAEIGS